MPHPTMHAIELHDAMALQTYATAHTVDLGKEQDG